MAPPTQNQIEALIRFLAFAEGLDPELCVRQCKQESSFHPDAINHTSGAIGLFQLEPATAEELGVDPRRWHENIFGGIKYDGRLFRQFGSADKMLAAYDWGPGHLAGLIKEHGTAWRDHLPAETTEYLDIILPAQPQS